MLGEGRRLRAVVGEGVRLRAVAGRAVRLRTVVREAVRLRAVAWHAVRLRPVVGECRRLLPMVGSVGRLGCVTGAGHLRPVATESLRLRPMATEFGRLRLMTGEAGRLRHLPGPLRLLRHVTSRRVRLLRHGPGRGLLRGVGALRGRIRCVPGGRSGGRRLPVSVPAVLLVSVRIARPGLLLPRRVLLPPRPARRLCRPRRGRTARQRGRRGAAPLLDQRGRGELARLVRKVAPGDGDGPLPGHVMAGCGLRPRGVLEIPLPGGSRVVREAVVLAVPRGPRVGAVRRAGSVRRLGAVRPLPRVVSRLLVRRVRVVPPGAVDGRAGDRPRARGRRVGSGGRGGSTVICGGT
ncbi:hypothetical protein SVIOM74S_02265 [Streptomyces violarus]